MYLQHNIGLINLTISLSNLTSMLKLSTLERYGMLCFIFPSEVMIQMESPVALAIEDSRSMIVIDTFSSRRDV